jgi:hypothetical protein
MNPQSPVSSLRCIAGAIVLAAGAVSGAMHFFSVDMDGAQEVPPNGSPGSGSALVELTASNVLTWYVSFENLTGAITALHFHGPAAAGVNRPVQINVGAINGLSSPLDGSATIMAPQAADLLAGLWYLNLHSSAFPGGELRGQVPPIPESCIGTLVLVAAAVAAARAKHAPSMAATYTNSAECCRRQA